MFAQKKEEKSSQLHLLFDNVASNLRVQIFGTHNFENAYIRDVLLRKNSCSFKHFTKRWGAKRRLFLIKWGGGGGSGNARKNSCFFSGERP